MTSGIILKSIFRWRIPINILYLKLPTYNSLSSTYNSKIYASDQDIVIQSNTTSLALHEIQGFYNLVTSSMLDQLSTEIQNTFRTQVHGCGHSICTCGQSCINAWAIKLDEAAQYENGLADKNTHRNEIDNLANIRKEAIQIKLFSKVEPV